ncbi:hypothetical protein Q4R52_16310 [Morganella morganii]
MKERGIIFNAEMVRAILDGRKTQTRQVINWRRTRFTEIGERDDGTQWPWSEDCEKACDYWHECPFGDIGDRLWVRETFGLRVVRDALGGTGEFLTYRASKPDAVYCAWDGGYIPMKWRPSSQMTRWRSRILLEITGVRVERLQDISQEDAHAEGFEGYDDDVSGGMPPYSEFGQAWVDIYGKDSWRENPWVWVIEFKRIQG